jgi:MFS family permease
LYVLGAMLVVLGTVIQDVVADAMSTEVVPRTDAKGNERPDNNVRVELGMVQVLGRLAVSAGVLAVAGLSGWLANFMPRQDVFLIGLVIPAISTVGVFLRGTETVERRPIDWRILGGGIGFGAVVLLLGVGDVPFGQEIILIISLAVVCYMLVLVTAELDHDTRMGILFATIIVFAFRAAPTVGEGFFWWTLDELKFDAAFYGTLRQTGAILSIAVMWMFSRQLTEASVTKTLLWIAVASTILSFPNIALVYGLHHWTEATFGFGARSIAFVDAAAASPFVQLSMIPLLTLTAYYAPPGHRATWFALMASLMNIALVASQLQTKYLNGVFVVGRGHYAELGPLLTATVVLGFVIPVGAVALFGRRSVQHAATRN